MSDNTTNPPDVPTSNDDIWGVGDTISEQFIVEEVLGVTPAGRSFRVKTGEGVREMALKTLSVRSNDSDLYASLRDPLKSISRLKHKNLVKIYGLGRDGDTVFVVMEFVRGQTLTRHVAHRRSHGQVFNPKGVFNIVAHICNGLAAIHTQMAHGALTPGHVHITEAGKVKIGNIVYGHAAAMGLFPFGQGVFADSPFTAPEFRDNPGEPTPQADLYALGMITAELLSPEPLGGLGFAARTAALAISDGYSGKLRALIAHATDRNAEQRLADPVEFRDRLKIICMDEVEPRPVDLHPEPNELRSEGFLEYSVSIGPPSTDEIVVEEEPTPVLSEEELDPFAQAAQILGTGPVPVVRRRGAKSGGGSSDMKQFLLSKENLDYGPYTSEEILEQLRKDEIDELTVVLDRTTQMRTPLGEHRTFAKTVEEYIPIREARRRHEREQRQQRVEVAKTAGRWTAVVGVIAALLIGLGLGVWYFFIRPQPADLPEQALIADLSSKYQMAPPPTEFADVALDEDLLAGLFSPEAPTQKLRKARGGRSGVSGRQTGERPRANSDENISDVDLSNEGGSTRILTDRDVNQTIRRGFSGVRTCMLQEVKRNPSFKGVSVQFFIRPTGTTGGVKISGSASATMKGCLKGRFRSLRFPQHGGLNRSVNLPLYVK